MPVVLCPAELYVLILDVLVFDSATITADALKKAALRLGLTRMQVKIGNTVQTITALPLVARICASIAAATVSDMLLSAKPIIAKFQEAQMGDIVLSMLAVNLIATG